MPNHKKVIPFPWRVQPGGELIKWRFFDYGKEIEHWYSGLSEDEQDTFDNLLKNNGKAETPSGWSGTKALQGECKEHGIVEWRFNSSGVQQRVLGIFGEERQRFIFLIGCNHKQNIYQPANCLETAIKRAKEARQGKAVLNERKVRTDI